MPAFLCLDSDVIASARAFERDQVLAQARVFGIDQPTLDQFKETGDAGLDFAVACPLASDPRAGVIPAG